jgi:outer membrane protein
MKPITIVALAMAGICIGVLSQPCRGQAPPAPQSAQPPQNLTLAQAEQIGLQNHPQVLAAESLAIAAQAQVREVRSAYYPSANGSLTGVEALSDSRIAAGGLNNPIIYDRFASGVTVGQLVTDFGRTHELVRSSSLYSQAQQQEVVTTRADVLLAVDQAYFDVLKAQAVLQVAQQTVQNRQVVADQISTMAQNQLKSDLDVSFANVDLAQARLLLIQAQNDLQVSFAQLSRALGYADERTFQLAEQSLPPAPPADAAGLVQQALANRPELAGERLDVAGAQAYAKAERDLYLPSISAVGAAGLTPYHASALTDRYAAAGVNINIPIFNGHLYGALRSEATARAQARSAELSDLTDRIVRDVRTAWLDANSAFQRLSVTDQLLSEATQSLDLAQARYNLGLSSIVELSQAQLNLTQAQIAAASAKYDYQTQNSALNYQIGVLR